MYACWSYQYISILTTHGTHLYLVWLRPRHHQYCLHWIFAFCLLPFAPRVASIAIRPLTASHHPSSHALTPKKYPDRPTPQYRRQPSPARIIPRQLVQGVFQFPIATSCGAIRLALQPRYLGLTKGHGGLPWHDIVASRYLSLVMCH